MLPLSAASSATVTAAAATAASAVAASSAVTSAATGATVSAAAIPIRLADAGLYRRPSPADNDSLSHMALIIPVS